MKRDDATKARFEALIEQHRGILHKIVRAYAYRAVDQQDLTQEIIVQLWLAFPKYEPARKFSTWMYRIALNTAIALKRSRQRRPEEPCLASLSERDQASNNPVQLDASLVIQGILAQLDDFDKALLLLYFEEHTAIEMSEILGISAPNVAVRISRLKQRIRQINTEETH
jgi:RNA polymerase sigma-70 factor (ECF subfamily)